MPAYSFQSCFADAVSSGKKRQTIRPIGKRRHAQIGKPVQLYTGMRTKHCRKLMDPDPVCTELHIIDIKRGDLPWLDGGRLTESEAHELALADGFKDVEEMALWFDMTHGLPFHGVLIRWKPCGNIVKE